MNEARALVENMNLVIPETPKCTLCPGSSPGAPFAVEIPRESVRLQKLLSQVGVASRRASEDLVKRGRVQVNGEAVIEMGLEVLPNVHITVNGQRIYTDATL